MENQFEVDGKVVNFDVFNALNLHNPMLGDAYVRFDWNPLGEDFKMDLPFLEKFLENQKYASETKMPSFMENNPEKVLESFKTAHKNNKQMLKELQNRYNSGEFSDFKGVNIESQVKDMIFYLKCREKMLEISIGQLKVNNIDALKAYENINALNRKLGELLEEAYTKEFNKKVLIDNMILQAQLNSEKNYGMFENMTKLNVFSQTTIQTKQPEFNIGDMILGVVQGLANGLGLNNLNMNNLNLNNLTQTQQNQQMQQYQNMMQNPTADNLAQALSPTINQNKTSSNDFTFNQ